MRIFDLHCDTIYECLTKSKNLDDTSLHINFTTAPEMQSWIQFFGLFIPQRFRGDAAVRFTKNLIETYNKQLSMFNDHFSDKPSSGKCKPLLSIENGAALGGDINTIREYFNEGVRMMTLTWNGENELGGGQAHGGGLTGFGFKTVSEMEKVGMVVDVSHLSDAGFNDVMSVATHPVCASHSNSRTICNHKRNLTDDQFTAIKNIGGIVGIVLCNIFLNESGISNYSDVLRHIEHFLSLGGENTIAIGTDFDGVGVDFDGTDLPGGMKGQKNLPDLYEYLLKHNIRESVLDKIFFKNAKNFFKPLVMEL